MCGRIETCLLIGVELVREGCGLSLNRTQKREGEAVWITVLYNTKQMSQTVGRNVKEVLKSPAVKMC